MEYIDLRSDTVTLPTKNMYEAMNKAILGDDILGEDPTVKKLEEMAANMFGKEAALFTVSGTMSNQIAVMTYSKRGQEIIVGSDSHIYNLEVGALAALSQVQVRPLDFPKGIIDLNIFKDAIHQNNIQVTETGLVCLENPYNLNKGLIMALDNISQIKEICSEYDIPVYMDGARIFNVAAALNKDVKDIVKHVDAVQVCLTKGLSAPIGSLLIGSHNFIQNARRIRQRLGGGMRQAGILAAAGIESLENMVTRLYEDNLNARYLAQEIEKINNRIINIEEVQTNIVNIDLGPTDINEKEFIKMLDENKLKIKRFAEKKYRMVTHRHITEKHIDKVVNVFESILKLKGNM